MTSPVHGKVSGNDVVIEMGDITKSGTRAIIVPQFTCCISPGGVSAAVERSGAVEGMKAYEDFISEKGEQEYGTVFLTPSGGGSSEYLLHVASVGSDEDIKFNVIKTSMLNALKVAEKNGIDSLAAPALGTGIIRSLTRKESAAQMISAERSAAAMMSAIKEYAAEGGKLVEVHFVIYCDQQAFDVFSEVLRKESGSNDKKAKQKPFNVASRVIGSAGDDAKSKKFGNAGGPDDFPGGPG